MIISVYMRKYNNFWEELMKKKIAFLIILLVIIIDQVVKISVDKFIPEGSTINFIGNIISLTHAKNTGGAYSLRAK